MARPASADPARDPPIAIGREGVGHEAVEAAARAARAHEFILDLEDGDGRRGYYAFVGERGVKLSGGQRPRVALAHRLSTVAEMDRIVVMDAGRVVEQGSHESLRRAGGLYASFWDRQSGGFLGEGA